jgi:hypothetical protein
LGNNGHEESQFEDGGQVKYSKADLIALSAGVAARLHMDRQAISAMYAPSTYVGAPAGYRDESATVRVSEGTHGVFISAKLLDQMNLSDAADFIASQWRHGKWVK